MIEVIQEILRDLRRFKVVTGLPFRKRAPEEVFESGLVQGCTDIALVFCLLCKKAGLEDVYLMETLDLIQEEAGVNGHVYCTVLLPSGWVVVDPTRQLIGADPLADGRIPIGSYLRCWPLASMEELKSLVRS